MATQSGDDQQHLASFSWRKPHAVFAIICVGPEGKPFAIQKNFLCAHSTYFRSYFAKIPDDTLEHIVEFSEWSVEEFGLVQNFLYTGRLVSEDEALPGYDILIAVWKIASKLGIPSLCEKSLEAMTEYRRITQRIPATPLLVQAWKDTPEGSEIRKLLLEWSAEYIRSSESRAEFSKSLPQEVLSELVIAMSHMNSAPVVQVDSVPSPGGQSRHKNVHYLEADESESGTKPKMSKRHHSDVGDQQDGTRMPTTRPARLATKLTKTKRSSITVAGDHEFSAKRKLEYCSDLLNRMLSGPGFWTRLVGPFRNPVNPIEDGVPDYLEKISRPMDLGTIKAKMDRNEYTSDEDFVADVRQIFTNCYSYWGKGSDMSNACEKFEKSFEEKYSSMAKWLAKMGSEEAT
ncbi:hypothetical protein DL764_007119 [Monosporascus ibericus]|uniref:Bromo domain-containing protein n=1 Tax=Monosporascus ibericus TaxID=155417 RepID=A0A4Q4T312_9PEZI|nr:hypothetical protein DL764_007119 [Monosporascus ibericus]